MKPWTLLDAPSMTGKHVLITGGNSGLGFETARMLVSLGANVVLACRNLQKAQQAIEQLRLEYPKHTIDYVLLDLSKLQSVRTMAEIVNSWGTPLDLLLNNAGVLAGPFQRTEDGFERQIGTNHFGHFALTGLLFPALSRSKSPRVVTVSSLAHTMAHLSINELLCSDSPRHYVPRWAYYRSKLANLLFTYELARLSEAHDASLKSIGVHPGIARTNLFSQESKKPITPWHYRILPMHSAREGALSLVRACVDEDAKNGDYYGPSGWLGIRGAPKKVKSSPRSHDPILAKDLWSCSQQLTQVIYQWELLDKEGHQ
ncbi:MAG: oxidoreductase [Bacilli bacterium]|jgi:NAD(P)-dependent dehydrogenase (short-subunit alcohol dehydrogenase family)